MVINDVKTELWNAIIKYCKSDGWRVAHEYDDFDKGIDHDFLLLVKDDQEVLFGWDNWFEGEIKCSPQLQAEFEQRFKVTFKMGEPEHLSDRMIQYHLSKRKTT
jgi:hypothetical protein